MSHRLLRRLVLWFVFGLFLLWLCMPLLSRAQMQPLGLEVRDERSGRPTGDIPWGGRHSIAMTAFGGGDEVTIVLTLDSRLRLVGWSGEHRVEEGQLIYETIPGRTVIAIVELPAEGCGYGDVAGTVQAFTPGPPSEADDTVVTVDFGYSITPGRDCTTFVPLVQGGQLVGSN